MAMLVYQRVCFFLKNNFDDLLMSSNGAGWNIPPLNADFGKIILWMKVLMGQSSTHGGFLSFHGEIF